MVPKSVAAAASDAQPHAWHVDKTNGCGEIVVAHTCTIHPAGFVSFYNRLPNGDTILVRAFHLSEWDDVVLVDTPFSPSIQLDSSIGKRS